MKHNSNSTDQKTGKVKSPEIKWFKRRKHLFLLIPLVLAVFLGFWYSSENDQDRLAHSYEYDNSLLCYLISNNQTRLKCGAVLTGDINSCTSQVDDYQQDLCFYGVVLKTQDVSIFDNTSFLNKTCYNRAISYVDSFQNKILKENLTEIIDSCKWDLLMVKNVCYKHLALKTRNLALCNEIVVDNYKFECTMRLTGNLSLCIPYKMNGLFYDQCVACLNKNVSYCDDLAGNEVDQCLHEFAEAYVDSNYCKMMKDRDWRNRCFIHIKELPFELQRFGGIE